MSKLAQQIPATLKLLDVALTHEERVNFITCSLARAISLELQLPTSPVASADVHFYDTHSTAVMQKISAINESYIVDVDTIFRAVKGFYLLRYSMVFEARDCSRVFSAVAIQSPDKIPPIMVDTLQKFNSAEVEEQFNILVWACRNDTSA